MDRRSLLKFAGMASVGFALEGCASTTSNTKPQLAPPQVRRVLPVVNVSWDRVIRTTIGLRPHRPSGFVLRADKLDDKVVIHNYGHGGAGMSLAWGCGVLVSELARPAGAERVAVIGCGSPGLCTAIQLQRRGYAVTIYAATMPPALGRFSITTCVLVRSDNFCPTSRMVMSAKPPGPKGMTTRMGLLG